MNTSNKINIRNIRNISNINNNSGIVKIKNQVVSFRRQLDQEQKYFMVKHLKLLVDYKKRST